MKVRVWMHSKVGMWEHDEGYVDVVVDDVTEAFDAAQYKLQRTTFPTRPSSSWVLDRLEILG
jgi:hypothetical protein